MSFREFKKWVNQRSYDGLWSMSDAIIALSTIVKIKEYPRLKRERIWRKYYKDEIVEKIIKPVNTQIMELFNC